MYFPDLGRGRTVMTGILSVGQELKIDESRPNDQYVARVKDVYVVIY